MEKEELLKLRIALVNHDKEVQAIYAECEKAKAQADAKCKAAILKEMGVDEALAKKVSATTTELQQLQTQWKNYIDKVHTTFERSINGHKKLLADRISRDYQSLTAAANQSTLTRNGELSYYQESAVDYALRHPFDCDSKALASVRSVAVILAIVWAVAVLIMAICDISSGVAISEIFSSSLIYAGLIVSILYILIEFVWSFLANKQSIEEANEQRRASAKRENNQILSSIADAKAKLEGFDAKFSKYFKTAQGTWNFAPEKIPIDRDTAEKLLREAQNANTRPKLPDGMRDYKFEINYPSL